MPRNRLWFVLAVTLAACSEGDRGVLEPKRDEGIELVSTHGHPNDTARLQAGGITADVDGRWSNQGESIEIRYRSGNLPARIEMTAASTWNGQTAPATAAWDRTVPEPGNAIGRPLLDAGPLRLAAGETKLVQVQFDRAVDGDRPSIGDEVTVTVPMPGGARATRFRVAGE